MEAIRSYFYGEYRIRLLIGIIIPLVVADGIISNFLVTQGLCLEANPFLRLWVVEPSFLTVKIVAGILVTLLLWDIYKRNQRLSFIASTYCVIVYTATVYWNVFAYFWVLNTSIF